MWQIKIKPQEHSLLSGFNQRVQDSTWLSNYINDYNDRNVLNPLDPGYKRIHLLLKRDWAPKHVCSSYSSVTIVGPEKLSKWEAIDNYWVHDSNNYTHTEKDEAVLLQAKVLSLKYF